MAKFKTTIDGIKQQFASESKAYRVLESKAAEFVRQMESFISYITDLNTANLDNVKKCIETQKTILNGYEKKTEKLKGRRGIFNSVLNNEFKENEKKAKFQQNYLNKLIQQMHDIITKYENEIVDLHKNIKDEKQLAYNIMRLTSFEYLNII